MKPGAGAIFVKDRSIPSPAAEPFARLLAAAALGTVLIVLGAASEGRSATFDQATLAASKSLEAKMQILESKDPQPSATNPPLIITEFEANSYLKVHSGEFLPTGVHTPAVSTQPEHATASADVDFDELSRTYPNPNEMAPKILAAMFHGTQHVTVVAKIQSENAGVRVQIESVVVGSMTMPGWLVDYVIQNVLQPRYNFDLSKPLPYPDHVTLIVVGAGQATFLRGPKAGN
ncbi:MAG: hypothetical protein ABSF45_24940 [Terriglobia bacterium]